MVLFQSTNFDIDLISEHASTLQVGYSIEHLITNALSQLFLAKAP